MRTALKTMSIGCWIALSAGCTTGQPETFTFTADLPPDFAYVAVVYYEPAKGETCTVETRDNKAPVFNRNWRTEYQPDAEITIRRTRNGCPLVISQIKLEINASYGKTRRDFGGDNAVVAIREELEEQYKGTFDEAGESAFYGQCQWLFRTSGEPRILRKILDCKKTNPLGEPGQGRPFAAYTLDQLPGKTVKMNIKLSDEEAPYYSGWWLHREDGWRPCTGRWGTSNEELCLTPPQFTDFMMPDGRKCTVYPGCTE